MEHVPGVRRAVPTAKELAMCLLNYLCILNIFDMIPLAHYYNVMCTHTCIVLGNPLSGCQATFGHYC